jgi:prepilin-type N-terminal cleavage/methylation domain-containing protein
MRSAEDGFTLVELLVVLLILALPAALVGPRVVGYMSTSKVKTATIQLSAYKTALELFHLDMGRYPATGEGLAALGLADSALQGANMVERAVAMAGIGAALLALRWALGRALGRVALGLGDVKLMVAAATWLPALPSPGWSKPWR